MEDSAEIQTLGMRWLLGAGIVASLFAVWLSCVDYKLSHSDVEQKRQEIMNEVRVAQSSIPGGDIDPRIEVHADSPVTFTGAGLASAASEQSGEPHH